MNNQKLLVGKVFKNYLNMCEELELPKYTQGSKQYKQQLKQLKAHFDIERVAGTYQLRITKVYTDNNITLNISREKHDDVIKLLKLANLI